MLGGDILQVVQMYKSYESGCLDLKLRVHIKSNLELADEINVTVESRHVQQVCKCGYADVIVTGNGTAAVQKKRVQDADVKTSDS